jgi:hypothetical protein
MVRRCSSPLLPTAVPLMALPPAYSPYQAAGVPTLYRRSPRLPSPMAAHCAAEAGPSPSWL